MTSTNSDGFARRWWTLVVLSLSLLVIALDNTILNVALPTLVTELDASGSQLQWIVDSYVLVFAGLLLVMGSLGDRYGRKLALYSGFAVFGLASLAAAYAGSSGMLIATRAVMGIGGALIMPATLSILVNVFPREERAKAIAIWSAVAGVGVPLGPVVGGWLLDHFWWGSIFLVNVPIIIGAMVAGFWLVPESKDEDAAGIDIPGGILSIAGLTALLYGIIEAPDTGWLDPMTLAAFGIAAVLLAGFIAWEVRTPEPMLRIDFFRNMRFTAGAASISLVFFALFGSIFLLTQYLQFVIGYTPFEAGLRMLPVAVGIGLGTGLSTRLVQKIGSKLVVFGGLTIVSLALLYATTLDVNSGYLAIATLFVLFGFGMGNTMAPATDSIMGSIPQANAGVGSAVNDTTRQVGGAMGVAILGSLFSTFFASEMSGAIAGLPEPQARMAQDSIGSALGVAHQIGGEPGRMLVEAANAGFVEAMGVAFMAAAAVAFAGALVSLAFLPAREQRSDEQEMEATELAEFGELPESEALRP
ncbi:MAG: DHA2 family efflux MFS transporter permease subunit [Thermomicrobiales bacterium]